jgi:predicted metal-dependent enzyme (double-stranded beta helix superfamily)
LPEVKFRHIDDGDWLEVRAQRHGDRRVSARLKFVDRAPTRTVIYAQYDPGMMIEEHGHRSDHVIFVSKGSVTIGDVECTPGMLVVLEQGATFGPLVAGPAGTELVEFYTGDPSPAPVDPEGFAALLAERGIVPVAPSAPA